MGLVELLSKNELIRKKGNRDDLIAVEAMEKRVRRLITTKKAGPGSNPVGVGADPLRPFFPDRDAR